MVPHESDMSVDAIRDTTRAAFNFLSDPMTMSTSSRVARL